MIETYILFTIHENCWLSKAVNMTTRGRIKIIFWWSEVANDSRGRTILYGVYVCGQIAHAKPHIIAGGIIIAHRDRPTFVMIAFKTLQ